MADERDFIGFLQFPNETLSNEYKDWLDLTVKHDKAVLAKAAIALSNHGGGFIVMGMQGPVSAPIVSKPRPANIPRYTPDAVNAAVNHYAEPKFHCDVSFAVHPETGEEHPVIAVPASSVPVMSIKLEEKVIAQHRCYIRKAGPMSEEPKTAEEWRTLLNRCIQAGRETMLDSIRTILQGHTITGVPEEKSERLEGFMQESFERWQKRLEILADGHSARMTHGHYQMGFELVGVEPVGLAELKSRLGKAHQTQYTGWPAFIDMGNGVIAPKAIDGVIEAYLTDPNEADYGQSSHYGDFWRAHSDGLFYEIKAYDEDYTGKVNAGAVLDVTLPVWRVGEALLFVTRVAETYDPVPEIRVIIEYSGLNNRALRSVFDPLLSIRNRRSATDRVITQTQVSVQQVNNNLAEVLQSLLAPLFEAFDFMRLEVPFISGELTRMRGRG